MSQTPLGKARDYAPGEEAYTGPQRTIYREGYRMGQAGAEAEHNPHGGRAARAIWESGRERGRRDAEGAGKAAGADES